MVLEAPDFKKINVESFVKNENREVSEDYNLKSDYEGGGDNPPEHYDSHDQMVKDVLDRMNNNQNKGLKILLSGNLVPWNFPWNEGQLKKDRKYQGYFKMSDKDLKMIAAYGLYLDLDSHFFEGRNGKFYSKGQVTSEGNMAFNNYYTNMTAEAQLEAAKKFFSEHKT